MTEGRYADCHHWYRAHQIALEAAGISCPVDGCPAGVYPRRVEGESGGDNGTPVPAAELEDLDEQEW